MAYEPAGAGAFDHALHDGSPMRMQWYFREESRLPVAFQTWELPAGGWEGEHSHSEEEPLDELYFLLEGCAEMTVSGVRHTLGPGDAVLAPAGAPHDFRNTGSYPVKVLVVWGRPGVAVDWTAFGSGRAAAAEAD